MLTRAFTTLLCCTMAGSFAVSGIRQETSSVREDGYRGIWFTLGQYSGEYGDKYSGGLGTYTANHVPIAIYARQVHKTFFVYGGTRKDRRHLLIMASYYDHRTGLVPRPTVVCDKHGVTDPHDNGAIALDDDGYIWVFVSGRGRSRPGFKYRSREPYSMEAFELVTTEELTYPQPWFIPGRGFFHLFTKYTRGRELYWETSRDGRTWTEDRKLAGIEGHYQVSCVRGHTIVTAFMRHPGGSVDRRTDLYVARTDDFGETWTAMDGRPLGLPLTEPDSPARIRPYSQEGRLVYVNDVNFDRRGNPIVLYIVSRGHEPGPSNGPRIWTIAHWTGRTWEFHDVTTSTHNYDMGSLYVEGAVWRIIGPTETGPQEHGTGGEIAAWVSRDEGQTWRKVADLTTRSPYNHSYVRRPVNAHPSFYALWADGHAFQESPSRLYFTNRACDTVWMLPPQMSGDFARPVRAYRRGRPVTEP